MCTNLKNEDFDPGVIIQKDLKTINLTESEVMDINNNFITNLTSFSKEEKVIAFDGAWMYTSSILGVFKDKIQNKLYYKVNCEEWSQYDEFVTEERLLKLTNETQLIKEQMDYLATLDRSDRNIKSTINSKCNQAKLRSQSFRKGEKIIAYDSFLLYDAEVIKTKQSKLGSKRTALYLVHFPGWSSDWDNWMSSKRMFKRTISAVRIKDILFKFWDVENMKRHSIYLQQNKKTKKYKKLNRHKTRKV